MPGVSEVTVRPATPVDAAEVARVQVTGWHEAYTGRMPQSVLDGLDVTQRTETWGRILAAGRSGVWVAEADGVVIGFAASGPPRPDEAVPDHLELYAIYVLAAYYGSGAGTALLGAAIGEAPASLWVLEDNPRARAFYRRHGFAPTGAVKDDTAWGDPIREVRLVRD